MHEQAFEIAWVSAQQDYSLAQLAELAGASETLLRELVEWGAISPIAVSGEHRVFAGASITTVRAACRLGADLELDGQGVALALALLERIALLEAELVATRARLPA
jgi:hypothetical protein